MDKTPRYCVLIITHGRPDSVMTDKTLHRQGYTGPIYYIIDDEDKAAERYRAKYGDAVIQFEKKRYADMTDEGDNFNNRRTTTHVRNAAYDIARDLGYEYFLVLDDDYSEFKFRTNAEEQYPSGRWTLRKTADQVFAAMMVFYQNSHFWLIACAQGGDFIGGHECAYAISPTIRRKAMNSFFCATTRRVKFVGRLNEDVNTYCLHGSRGQLFGTIPLIALDQEQTQGQAGGMTEAYIASGTYVKSFYTVMMCPSFVRVSTMNTKHARVHHAISWKNAVPVILEEKYAHRTKGGEGCPVT
jgi:hypothetical protein